MERIPVKKIKNLCQNSLTQLNSSKLYHISSSDNFKEELSQLQFNMLAKLDDLHEIITESESIQKVFASFKNSQMSDYNALSGAYCGSINYFSS